MYEYCYSNLGTTYAKGLLKLLANTNATNYVAISICTCIEFFLINNIHKKITRF